MKILIDNRSYLKMVPSARLSLGRSYMLNIQPHPFTIFNRFRITLPVIWLIPSLLHRVKWRGVHSCISFLCEGTTQFQWGLWAKPLRGGRRIVCLLLIFKNLLQVPCIFLYAQLQCSLDLEKKNIGFRKREAWCCLNSLLPLFVWGYSDFQSFINKPKSKICFSSLSHKHPMLTSSCSCSCFWTSICVRRASVTWMLLSLRQKDRQN